MKNGRKNSKRKSVIRELMEPPYLNPDDLYFGTPSTEEEYQKAIETKKIMQANLSEICRRYYELVYRLKLKEKKDPNFIL